MPHQNIESPLVSVIIPAYNCEQFLRPCLDSVLNQTMPNFEVIAVNDGSTDGTLNILHEYAVADDRLRVLDQVNSGQGFARNRALAIARGRYVLFVDADDLIEPVTLQLTTARAEQDAADLVHFDWKLLTEHHDRKGKAHYYNADPFWHHSVLTGAACDELLRVENLYSVSNLYRRSFLNEHHIRFEEGRIYEDNPFVLHAVNRAQKVALVHSPLYTVRPHAASTTRSHTTSDRHARDHIYAMSRSFELLNRRNPRAAAYLAAYHVKKIGPYYERRVPKRHRSAYIRDFVDVLHDAEITIPAGTPVNRPTRVSVTLGLFEHRRYAMFHALVAGKNYAMPKIKRQRAMLRTQKRRITGNHQPKLVSTALASQTVPGTICFLGFDYRYAGNSRFLFEALMREPACASRTIRFITTDPRVPAAQRLEPGTAETAAAVAQSEVVIAESWIPASLRKHRDSTWVQLWHGTPIKRMLFDSHEPQIMKRRRGHKVSKYADIQNWDYLVVDCERAAQKFETAFLFDPARIIHSGYPRVNYLREHDSDAMLKQSIRDRIGIDPNRSQKVVLYAPTWRDYNYGSTAETSNSEYVLDIDALAEALGEGWVVLFHDHGYIGSAVQSANARCIDVSNIETQELLLISDAVVSDYSSIVFDAQAIGRTVVLYATDQDAFEQSRGVYADIWDELSDLTADNIDGVVECLLGASLGETLSSENEGLRSHDQQALLISELLSAGRNTPVRESE